MQACIDSMLVCWFVSMECVYHVAFLYVSDKMTTNGIVRIFVNLVLTCCNMCVNPVNGL